MFEPASPTMPGAFSPAAAEPHGTRRNNVYHPPTPSTAPQTPSTLASSSYFFHPPAGSPATMSRQNENQRPLFVNRKRSRQDTVTGVAPQLQQFGQFGDGDTIIKSRNTSSNYETAMGSGNTSRNVSSTFNSDIPPSPMPFVNTTYALKGGLDTPTAQHAAYFEQDGNTESEFSDVNYRRTLATGRRTASARHIQQGPEKFEREYHSFARLPSSASLESNGRPRLAVATNAAPASPGWGKLAGGLAGGVVGGVAGVVGTVVGKVWQFCKAGGFSGFNAGGGEGYRIDPNHTKEEEIRDDLSTTQIEFPDPPPAYSEAPLSEYREPGEESVCIVDYPTPEPTAAQRPAKRRQISHEAAQNNNYAAIERSWVVVPIPSVPCPPAPAPCTNSSRNPKISGTPLAERYSNASSAAGRRLQSSLASPARPTQRRPMMHQRQSNSVSSTGSPRFIPSRPSTATTSYASPQVERPSTASYASPRSSFGPSIVSGGCHQSRLPRPATPRSGASTPTATPTRSQIPLPSNRSSRTSVAGNRHTPRSSIGGAAAESPAAVEAKKWREQKKKDEAEEDIAMKRLNKQLQDMIKEGQAALGTRFEVREGIAEDVAMDDY